MFEKDVISLVSQLVLSMMIQLVLSCADSAGFVHADTAGFIHADSADEILTGQVQFRLKIAICDELQFFSSSFSSDCR